MLRQASLPGSVCVYSGSGDPYKDQRIDNRFARAGTCWPNKHGGPQAQESLTASVPAVLDGLQFVFSFEKKKRKDVIKSVHPAKVQFCAFRKFMIAVSAVGNI